MDVKLLKASAQVVCKRFTISLGSKKHINRWIRAFDEIAPYFSSPIQWC